MAITVSFRGVNYIVPEPNDANTQSLTDLLNALVTGAVPFPTTADIDLGASFGIKALDFKTRAANPAASGLVRLSLADLIAWRNNANNADLLLGVGGQDQLQWRGSDVTGNPMLGANTAAGQSIPNNAITIVVYGTVETDTDAGYNSGTGRYTVPAGKGGHYLVSACAGWGANGAGAGAVQYALLLFKNGAEAQGLYDLSITPGTAVQSSDLMSGSAILSLAAGDIVDVRAFQSTGGALALAAVAVRNRFALKRIPA